MGVPPAKRSLSRGRVSRRPGLQVTLTLLLALLCCLVAAGGAAAAQEARKTVSPSRVDDELRDMAEAARARQQGRAVRGRAFAVEEDKKRKAMHKASRERALEHLRQGGAVKNITIAVPSSTALVQGLADEFTANVRPDINILIRNYGWGGLFGAIAGSADNEGRLEDTGEILDLAWLGSTWVPSFVLNQRLLEPLTDYLAAWGEERAQGQIDVDFASRTEFDYKISTAGEPAQWYAIPFIVDARLFFYRKDWYREVLGSDDPPADLAEAYENGRRIREHFAAQGRDVSGFALSVWPEHSNTMQDMVSHYLGYGGAVREADKTCGFTTDKFRAGFEEHARLYTGSNPISSIVNATAFTTASNFCQGNLAQAVLGAWEYWGCIGGVVPEMAWGIYDENVGMIAPPAGPSRRATFFGSSALSILSTSPNKDAAFDFMKFVLEPTSAEYERFLDGGVPAFKSLLESFDASTRSASTAAVYRALPFAYPQNYPDTDFPGMGDVEADNVVSEMVWRVYQGEETVEQATVSGCAHMDAALAAAEAKRLARFPPEEDKTVVVESDSVPIALIVGPVVGALLILIAVGVVLWRRQAKKHETLVGSYKKDVDTLAADRKATSIEWDDLHIGRLLGAGAFGDVFQGDFHGTTVAIKKLKIADKQVADDLRAEAAIAARLRHPNCVLFMGTTEDKSTGELGLVTEFMAQGSLYDILHRTEISMELPVVLNFIKDAALGMAYLHSRSPPLLHRDVKAGNVLIDDKMTAKVSDFGLSAISHAGSGTAKETVSTPGGDVPPGSLYWMAPEVIRGEPYTTAADVYSFGILMWEAMTRSEPYDGENPLAIVQQVLFGRRPEIGADVPAAVRSLMERCWAEDPAQRPAFKDLHKELVMAAGAMTGTIANAGAVKAPTGEITLVFTDVQDSTSIWEECASEMRTSLTLHFAVARSLLRELEGYEVNTEGDAFMLAFASPQRAVRWAVRFQEELVKMDWPADLLKTSYCKPIEDPKSGQLMYAGLRVRIGMLTGKPQAQLDPTSMRMDYFGRVVNKAARVSGTANGGEIVISNSTYELVKADGVSLDSKFEEIGSTHLKGIAEPELLHRVVPNSLPGRLFLARNGAANQNTGTHSGTSTNGTFGVQGTRAGSDEQVSTMQYDEAVGRIETMVKSQSWTIDWNDVTVGRALGKGSFGDVFEGKWRGQIVAVKKLLATRLTETHMLRFYEEMAICSALRHPNIVLFMGASVTPPHLSVITELAPHGSLDKVLASNMRTKQLDLATKVKIASNVASALVYLHSHKPPVLHRDLKSANILMFDNNVAKLADMGLTTARRAAASMSVVGTASYMAPEVLAGKSEYDPSSDVYAFGVVLFELISETIPFSGLPATKVGMDVIKGKRPQLSPSKANDAKVKPLVTLMEQCWAEDKDNRPDMLDVVERLSAIANAI